MQSKMKFRRIPDKTVVFCSIIYIMTYMKIIYESPLKPPIQWNEHQLMDKVHGKRVQSNI